MKKEKSLLITGCGRSGTTYICELLAKNGIHIGHEVEGEDGIASWPMTITDTKELCCGSPIFQDFVFKNIFHQVRNPVKTISSCLTISDSSWKYIKKHIPIGENDSKLIMSAKYWYCWNIIADSMSSFTYRIEDIENILPIIILKASKGSLNMESINITSNKINARAHNEIKLIDIKYEDRFLYKNIMDLAKKYGYQEKDLI